MNPDLILSPIKKAPFIVFEGIDGSGKSTQARLLAEHLQSQQLPVYFTCEPTKEKTGLLLRDILTGKSKADERVIAGLFLADRLQHILDENTGMLKQIEQGHAVICDRYYFSSYAYNGLHTDMDWVIAANAMCAKALKPEVHIFIDVPPEICMERVRTHRAQTELYETEDNLQKVRNNFFTAFEKLKHNENVAIVNGNRPVEEVAAEIRDLTKSFFKRVFPTV